MCIFLKDRILFFYCLCHRVGRHAGAGRGGGDAQSTPSLTSILRMVVCSKKQDHPLARGMVYDILWVDNRLAAYFCCSPVAATVGSPLEQYNPSPVAQSRPNSRIPPIFYRIDHIRILTTSNISDSLQVPTLWRLGRRTPFPSPRQEDPRKDECVHIDGVVWLIGSPAMEITSAKYWPTLATLSPRGGPGPQLMRMCVDTRLLGTT